MPIDAQSHLRRSFCTALLLGAYVLPAAAAPAFELQGKGVQIYTCSSGAGGFAWRLKAPDATLTDSQGNEVGHHFAGPSWQGQDGSLVTGEVETSAAGATGSIPWLILRAKTHAGQGMFATVTAIVRSHTQGGAAPAAGCDEAHAGTETRVAYSAMYSFFPG